MLSDIPGDSSNRGTKNYICKRQNLINLSQNVSSERNERHRLAIEAANK